MRPALLVRSGEGTPMWVSPLECQKLATGKSTFECCASNHTLIKECRRSTCLKSLDEMVERRARSQFAVHRHEEARMTLCLKTWWLRGFEFNRQKISSIERFKNRLTWESPVDKEWFDRCEFSILLYASLNDQTHVVRELLGNLPQDNMNLRAKYLCSRIPKSGLSTLGFTGHTSALHCAMSGASEEIVALLLQHGANPYECDAAGNDPLMFASIFGRTDTVKFWLKRYPDWDLERKNKVVGGVALGHAVYMGPRRLELVKVLVKHGASLDYRTDTGGSVLTSLCENEDADPEVLELLLKTKMKTSVNYRRRSCTAKWRIIYRLARFLTQNKLTKSGLMNYLALESGCTALHYAVQRGDVDVVNLLLEHGADPTIKNDLGKSPVDYCDAFPELRGALKRVIQQRKEGKQVMLHRRISTATDMKFPMYLVPLDQLERLYGGREPRYDRIEAHQDLLSRGELVRWIDLPVDAVIIFLSHEWIGWHHPDPHGVQLKTFLRVMKRLRSGDISQVEMNVFHTLMYKTNHVVKAEELQDILSRAYVLSVCFHSPFYLSLIPHVTNSYVWIDWSSMPQPSACPPETDEKIKKELGTNLGKAVKSIPAYVVSSLHTQPN